MAQASRPCKGCGELIYRTIQMGPIKHYCSTDCRPRCLVDGCEKPRNAGRWCVAHEHRAYRYGDPEGGDWSRPCKGCGTEIPRTNPQAPIREYCSSDCRPRCSVEGCENPTHSGSWCCAHAHRVRKYGAPTYVPEPSPSLPCEVEGCEELRHGRLYCSAHHHRQARYGSPFYVVPTAGPVAWQVEDVTYAGAHRRVYALRGKASARVCEHCGSDARHWAYDHEDLNELITSTGRPAGIGRRYSTDPSHYIPLCVSCHSRFDA